ncbi:MAG: Pyruvate kinase [Candidatus Daviesbacteria bacterium GW2011_GWA2_38_24]|uniref:Pyruvate kinase n=1 Tax=Candidatus Daviesbacteria bacterium GW2011_GWA2_38_24 TaxID=1618422 RepID=A0A0G0JGM0_9BACT|nr:MAG: Pyruvate kinase [Candidatus Daviesbacteria bacterium GW2011_GWA2_38_24]KKQ79331.1 MAG: Pyruvate kinase [Candidatus Daviesbacteria bacterium GW2011_GWA1_38_7]
MQQKKTKIVATIGPASWDPSTLEALAKAGMDVARLNFSHGTHEEKGAQIQHVRNISQKLNKPIAVMADLQGPKIRLGKIEGEVTSEEARDNKLMLKKGQTIELSTEPKEGQLPMQFDLSPFVKKGQRILLNDGLVQTNVDGVSGKTIRATVQNDGWVSSNKGVNVPDTLLPGASLTSKDYADAEFALRAGADYLAISFVQTIDDVKAARDIIKKANSRAKIIVKLEKPQALENLEEIIQITDVVMVARGDLAIETEASKVPLVQKRILQLGRQYFKPVIVATQMLESMTENPRPTRAEVSDVASAVFDQADAVMLSGETANGKYPVQAVEMMQEIIESVESQEEYRNYISVDMAEVEVKELSERALAASAALLSELVEAKLIIVGTATGRTALSLSTFRPEAQIVAITHDEQTKNQLALLWGVRPYVVQPNEVEAFWKQTLELAKESKLVKKSDKVVTISGSVIGVSGQTDTIRLATV